MLLKRAYTKDEIRQFASRSKFRTCTIDDDAIGMNIGLEKQISSQLLDPHGAC
jgi:hypothetical protein